MNRRIRKARVVFALFALIASGVAFADGPGGGGGGDKGGGGNVEVELTAKGQDPNGKYKDDAPFIEATIIGGQNVGLDQFTIKEANAKLPISIKASNKRDFLQGNETVAIALVINGQEVWIGNDEIEEKDSPSLYPAS
jgi:hypothetical protein